jgi:dehydrogenase/reductase SDR family protein 12
VSLTWVPVMTPDHERGVPGTDLIDRTLEASVLGSFSRIGFLARRSLGLLGPLERIDGRCCWITGGSSGLGLTTALELARLGARVHLVVPDAERGAGVKTRILERDDSVHVLIHNAGVLPHERRETADGIELTFATNVLGPYLLTEVLHERLRASASARVLFVTSGGMYTERLAVDDLQSRDGPFRASAVYSRTKRAELAICQEWAETLRGSGIVVHAMHPGWSDSPGIRDALPGFARAIGPILRTPEEGVDTLVWLASSAQAAATSGLLWLDRRPRPIHRLARTRDSRVERRSLLAECARLARVEWPALAAGGVPAVG